jgi:hypothetical protein
MRANPEETANGRNMAFVSISLNAEEDHPLSAGRDCLFNIFAAALHIGGRSSIRNLRTRHDVVTCECVNAAFPKLWSADHRWSSGSALVVLLD